MKDSTPQETEFNTDVLDGLLARLDDTLTILHADAAKHGVELTMIRQVHLLLYQALRLFATDAFSPRRKKIFDLLYYAFNLLIRELRDERICNQSKIDAGDEIFAKTMEDTEHKFDAPETILTHFKRALDTMPINNEP